MLDVALHAYHQVILVDGNKINCGNISRRVWGKSKVGGSGKGEGSKVGKLTASVRGGTGPRGEQRTRS